MHLLQLLFQAQLLAHDGSGMKQTLAGVIDHSCSSTAVLQSLASACLVPGPARDDNFAGVVYGSILRMGSAQAQPQYSDDIMQVRDACIASWCRQCLPDGDPPSAAPAHHRLAPALPRKQYSA